MAVSETEFREKLLAEIKETEKKENICFLFRNLTDKRDIVSYKADETVISASTIKVPLMLAVFNEVFEKRASLEDVVRVEKEEILPSEVFDHDIEEMSLMDLVSWSVIRSDNTATNLLIKYLGYEKINAYFAKLGLKSAILQRKMLDVEAQRSGLENRISLSDLCLAFTLISEKKILSPELCELALTTLYRQRILTGLTRYVYDVRVAHKTGSLKHINHDVGIFEMGGKTYFLGIMLYNTPLETGDRVTTGLLAKECMDFLR